MAKCYTIKRLLFFHIFFFLLINCSTPLYEETRSLFRIKVMTEDGAELPAAEVTIIGKGIPPLTELTNEMGIANFFIPYGKYLIYTEFFGFFPRATIIDFKSDGKNFYDIKMEVDWRCVEFSVTILPDGSLPPFIEEFYKEIEKFDDLHKQINKGIEQLSVGKILYNSPTQMKVFDTERVEVRISQNINEDLDKRLKGRGFPQVEKVLVGSVMKVGLSGDDFNIKSLSEKEQFVNTSDYTQWEWNLTPLKSGEKIIYLSLSVSVFLDKFGEKKKSLPVIEKKIWVKVNIFKYIFHFIKIRWYAVITLIISLIGLIFAYEKRKKKKKKGEKSTSKKRLNQKKIK